MPGSTRPLSVLSGAGPLPSLRLQWRRSSAPVTPQPRPRLLLPAQQLRPPRPFSPRTPRAPRLGSLRMRGPLQPVGFPSKSPFHQVPSAHAIPRKGGRGVVSFAPDSPTPRPRPLTAGPAPIRTAGARTHTPWCSSTRPNIYPQSPLFCGPALPLPTKLPQCGLDSIMPGFPSMTPGVYSCNKRNANGQRMPFPFVLPSTIHLRGLQAHWEHLLPPPFFWQLVHHRQICACVCLPLTVALGGGCQHPHFTDQEPEAKTHWMN